MTVQLISAFVLFRYIDSIIPLFPKSEISSIFCCSTAQFMFDLETTDRFSQDKAQIYLLTRKPKRSKNFCKRRQFYSVYLNTGCNTELNISFFVQYISIFFKVSIHHCIYTGQGGSKRQILKPEAHDMHLVIMLYFSRTSVCWVLIRVFSPWQFSQQ